MIRQRTIKNSVSTVGVGLHTGKKVKLTLKAAPLIMESFFVEQIYQFL